jgi:hypothetical protein
LCWANNSFYFEKGFFWFNYYLKDLVSTAAGRSTTIDIVLLGIACNIWMVDDAKKNKVPHLWDYLLSFWFIAMAFSFPIYLIKRKKYINSTES